MYQSAIATKLRGTLFGQDAAIDVIAPVLSISEAGLSRDNKPLAVFLLLGPTGTGKTKTVEALAEALHGSSKKMIRIDCGEFQLDHEVAKFLGAPPGYLGYRETQPLLTQQKLTGAASDLCTTTIVLFDEIEKASDALARLLLGVLDRGQLRLGDSTTVNFDKVLIFLTSNLGAFEMRAATEQGMGFAGPGNNQAITSIGMKAARKKYSPEFMNRLDAIVTYNRLDATALRAIVEAELAGLQSRIYLKKGRDAFRLEVSESAKKYLVQHGTSTEYGARELKRLIDRELIRPLAELINDGQIIPNGRVTVICKNGALAVRPAAISAFSEAA